MRDENQCSRIKLVCRCKKIKYKSGKCRSRTHPHTLSSTEYNINSCSSRNRQCRIYQASGNNCRIFEILNLVAKSMKNYNKNWFRKCLYARPLLECHYLSIEPFIDASHTLAASVCLSLQNDRMFSKFATIDCAIR